MPPRRAIAFHKLHGAGNDFVFVDDRDETFPAGDRAWLAALAARRTGIGCEGFGLLRRSDRADVRLVFLNPDGGEADLCGNGTRCAALLANRLAIAPPGLTIETAAGIVRAAVTDTGVRLELPDATGLRPAWTLRLDGDDTETVGSIDTGVPHAVIAVPDPAAVDVDRRGRRVREHAAFDPTGTNVNFVGPATARGLPMRTYERGVEAESGACGTGAVAVAIVMAARGATTPPVTLLTAGGFCLEVDFTPLPGGATGVSLTGPAAYVYGGTLDYGD